MTRAYRVIFFAYAAIGLIKLLLAWSLSRKVEAEKKQSEPTQGSEQAPLLSENGSKKEKKQPFWKMLPALSRESAVILLKLCPLFALDSIASGLTPMYGNASAECA